MCYAFLFCQKVIAIFCYDNSKKLRPLKESNKENYPYSIFKIYIFSHREKLNIYIIYIIKIYIILNTVCKMWMNKKESPALTKGLSVLEANMYLFSDYRRWL